jgi:carboxyl-terminal processing protease
VKRMLSIAFVLLLIVSAAVAQSDQDGVWESDGYGYIFVTNGSSIQTLYEVSSVHCVEAKIPIPLSDLTAALEGDQLIVRDTHTVHITAHRLDALPERCQNAAASDDPELNFEAFWNTFNEHYAFFDLYNVDWQAQYDTYRPQVTAETTPDQLWDVLCAMIQPLKDGHISLTNADQAQGCGPNVLPGWATSGDQALSVVIQGIGVIAQTYLGGDVHLDFRTGSLAGDEPLIAGDWMFYGRISDEIGYVNILSMDSYRDTGDAGVYAAADRVVADLAGMETLIVDVRFNGGGADAISLALASRFADQERVVFAREARNGDSFTPLRDYAIAPQGETQFTGNILLLTSGLTVSAAETFTLAMESLPYVTQIGEPTLGSYSDILFRTLPNGWEYGLSNERYYSADGIIYEGAGDPPEIEVLLDPGAYEDGWDNILDAAIDYAESLHGQ